MMAHRLRRQTNGKPTLIQCLVSAGGLRPTRDITRQQTHTFTQCSRLMLAQRGPTLLRIGSTCRVCGDAITGSGYVQLFGTGTVFPKGG